MSITTVKSSEEVRSIENESTLEYQTKYLQKLAGKKCNIVKNENAKVENENARVQNESDSAAPKEVPGLVNIALRDLLQISLGSTQLTSVNLAILYSFLNIMLKKLDCENEIVSIGGFEGECIKKLLIDARPTPLPFNDENVEILAKTVKKFKETEERAVRVEDLLMKHLQDIHRCKNVPPFVMNFSDWEMYNQSCEDVYIRCDPDNGIACDLLHNTDFLRKLARRIAFPMVERMFELEAKIEKMALQLQELIDEVKKQFERLILIDAIVDEIEKLKQCVHKNYIKFIGAMEEVQDMLDSKMDKLHMPALKKYLKENFDKLQKQINALKQERDCAKAAGFINDGVTCVSCGNSKICAQIGETLVASLPAFGTLCCDPKKYKKKCNCNLAMKKPTTDLVTRINNLDVTNIVTRLEKKVLPECSPTDVLITGADGSLYRGDKNTELYTG